MDTFVITHHFPWPINTLAVRMKNGNIILCNAPFVAAHSQRALSWVREYLGEGLLHVINTDFTIESTGGNQFFLGRGDSVIGSDITELLFQKNRDSELQSYLKKAGPTAMKTEPGQPKFEMMPPNSIFIGAEGRKLKMDEVEIEIDLPGDGATPDNAVVYFPHTHVLYAGRLVSGQQALSRHPLSDLALWRQTLEELKKNYPAAAIIVPMEGKPGGPELIDQTMERLATNP
jgi:glyoxylase-like metal-dependent hydrolase (beta-lactamase superfamily II)